MGLETADSGTIEGLEGRSFSAVFQEDRLLEGYTALQNIRFVTGRGYPAHELTAIIKHLLPEDSLKKASVGIFRRHEAPYCHSAGHPGPG